MRLEVDGLALNIEVHGAGEPLVALHGFTGSSETWAPFVTAWPGFQVIAVDLIGHGKSDSPHDPVRYSMDAHTAALCAVLDGLAVSSASLLGYSLGARIALHFALRHPDRLSRLILESASPGIAGPSERDLRRQDDEALAARIERDGIEAFVDYWERLPLWKSQESLRASLRQTLRAQRLRNSPTGLANSLRGVGAGACLPVFDRLGEITCPALFIAGALDARYVDLARLSAKHVQNATLRIIERAGHATHLEQPEIFAAAVGEFLAARAITTAQEARS